MSERQAIVNLHTHSADHPLSRLLSQPDQAQLDQVLGVMRRASNPVQTAGSGSAWVKPLTGRVALTQSEMASALARRRQADARPRS